MCARGARTGRITLEAFANDWLTNHNCAPSTKAKYRSLLDAQIIPPSVTSGWTKSHTTT